MRGEQEAKEEREREREGERKKEDRDMICTDREKKNEGKERRDTFLEWERTRKACVVKNSRSKQKAERGETSEHRSALCFMLGTGFK